MAPSFDVIVAGLGAMGSAALRELSARGLNVLGLDRFAPPHTLGSSHGRSRIIREAYFEHPAYVPLVQRAYELWEELERESGRRLKLQTGGLMVGPEEGVLVRGALLSARTHHLRYELIDAAEIRRRFPAFHPDDSMVGVWEPRAGVLEPEACVDALLTAARRSGGVIHEGEPALSWKPDGEGVTVATSRDRYRAERLVLSAGAWVGRLLPELAIPLTVERLVQFWFEPGGDRSILGPDRCPISIWEHQRNRFFYGFPLLEPGFKVAIHHEGEIVDPDAIRREVADTEPAPLVDLLRRYMPDGVGRLSSSAVCMYTNTPDENFIIDHHPMHPQVLIVSACSGHGFKFAPAIGEVAAELVMEGKTEFDLSLFGVRRFARPA